MGPTMFRLLAVKLNKPVKPIYNFVNSEKVGLSRKFSLSNMYNVYDLPFENKNSPKQQNVST